MESTNRNSSEARKIHDRVNGINSKWTDLMGRLEEPAWKLCKKFADDCDDLSIVKGDIEEALKHVNALEDRMKALWPLLAEVDASSLSSLLLYLAETPSLEFIILSTKEGCQMKKPESRKTEDLILLVTKATADAPVHQAPFSTERCEDCLSPHDALGDTGRDPKMLECMKAIQEETKALDQRLVALDGTTQALVDGAYKHGSNACHIADQAEAIRGRYADLRQQLEERCAALQVVFEAAAEFLEVLKSVTVDLSSLEQEFDSMEAPARLLPVVQTQLDQVADFFARLQQYHDHLEETRSASEKLTKQGRDIQSSTDQITNMEKHILKLEERSKARNDELERVLGKLESFYGLLDKVLINIEESSNEEEFCEKLRNPLEETVLEANTGQGLVQSATPGVTTTKLEGDIENINEKWNT
ncbi:hypothetical protein QYM36_014326 [Artemia franciscana]|uniref:Uncharacterized protein n=1 Tax=Artemia franciscana TaxID=6661 RepID=A0AA88HB19_ARTSF|nr:hypothetical protein QYM36_014326 [Artemia franciscana]